MRQVPQSGKLSRERALQVDFPVHSRVHKNIFFGGSQSRDLSAQPGAAEISVRSQEQPGAPQKGHRSLQTLFSEGYAVDGGMRRFRAGSQLRLSF